MTLEANLSRRDLLTFAKRNRGQEGQSSRRSSARGLTAVPPSGGGPSWWDGILTRRAFLGGAVTLATGAAGMIAAEELGITDLFAEKPQPEDLQSLVRKAREMEDSFKDRDLSDRNKLQRYLNILAGVITLDTPSHISKDDFLNSVIYGSTIQDYNRLSQQYSGGAYSPIPLQSLYNHAAETVAGKVLVNLAHHGFNNDVIRHNSRKFPPNWNPLREFRRTMIHEYKHLIAGRKKDPAIFEVLGLSEQDYQDMWIQGSRVTVKDEKGKQISFYSPVNEAIVIISEMASSQRLFGTAVDPESYIAESGVNVSAVAVQLRRVVEAAGISVSQLEELNTGSELRKLWLLLAERAGLSINTPERQRLEYADYLFRALWHNEATTIEDYIKKAKAQVK